MLVESCCGVMCLLQIWNHLIIWKHHWPVCDSWCCQLRLFVVFFVGLPAEILLLLSFSGAETAKSTTGLFWLQTVEKHLWFIAQTVRKRLNANTELNA